MRLLFVAPNLEAGGAERQWSILIPRLAERGFAVKLLTLDGTGPFFDTLARAGVDVACASLRSRWDPVGLARAARLAGRPDVVVTRGVSAQVVGHALARRSGAAHVTTDHTGVGTRGRLACWRRDQALLIRHVGSRADRVVAVSAAQVPALVESGYPRERIRVVPNGVDAALPTRDRAAVRGELGLADDAFVVLLGAALRPEKRVDDFVAALDRAHGENPRVRGVIAGGGAALSSLEERCRRTGVVRALGRRADMPDLLAASDAVALTSSAEACPMILLEALAAGRPLVATAVGGTPEIVADGENGTLFPAGDVRGLADAIATLARDADLVCRYGAVSHARHAAGFTAAAMVDGYESVLLESAAVG